MSYDLTSPYTTFTSLDGCSCPTCRPVDCDGVAAEERLSGDDNLSLHPLLRSPYYSNKDAGLSRISSDHAPPFPLTRLSAQPEEAQLPIPTLNLAATFTDAVASANTALDVTFPPPDAIAAPTPGFSRLAALARVATASPAIRSIPVTQATQVRRVVATHDGAAFGNRGRVALTTSGLGGSRVAYLDLVPGGRGPGSPEQREDSVSRGREPGSPELRGDSVSHGQKSGFPEPQEDPAFHGQKSGSPKFFEDSLPGGQRPGSPELCEDETYAVGNAMARKSPSFLAGILVGAAISAAVLVIMYVISDGFAAVVTTSTGTIGRVAVYLAIYVLRRGIRLFSSLSATAIVVSCTLREWWVVVHDAIAAALDEVEV